MPLGWFRERLATFQTVWIRFGGARLNSAEMGHGDTLLPGVIRIDAATQRAVFETTHLRYTWDGTNAYKDSLNSPAVPLGSQVDAQVAAWMQELVDGLPQSAVQAPREHGIPNQSHSWRIDLPGAADDPYFLLFDGLGGPYRPSATPKGFRVLRADTLETLRWGGGILSLVLDVRWDVRLEDDLSNPESLHSRRVETPSGDFEGPRMFPPYHVSTTHDRMTFDAAGSQGTVGAGGQEVPTVEIPEVLCTAAGQVVQVPLQMRFRLDPSSEAAPFLPDAQSADCPLAVRFGAVHAHRVPRAPPRASRARSPSATPPPTLRRSSSSARSTTSSRAPSGTSARGAT